MRVLQLLSSAGLHGAETMTIELARQLARLGVTVDIGVFDVQGTDNAELFAASTAVASEVHHIRCAGQIDRRAFAMVRDCLKRRTIDVTHSHKYKTTFYGMVAGAGLRTGLITTYHNWLTHTPALRLYAAIDKTLARFNDVAVAVSTPVAQELRKHMPAKRVLQIDNGIDTDIFERQMSVADAKAALGFAPDRPLVGFVGRLSLEKGLPYLLQALQQIDPTVMTAIVGEGEMRGELETQIAALGLADRVRLLGNRRDTPRLYSAFDAFVLPSTREAFPMVLLEAMACGCPVVATRVGEVERIVEHGRTGWVIDPAQPAQITEALKAVLSNTDTSAIMRNNGRQRVVSLFSSGQMARRYLEQYEQVLRRHAADGSP